MRHLLDTKVGDYDAMIPMVEMDTIGAGGGSSPTSTPAASSASGRGARAPIRARPATGAGATEPAATDACSCSAASRRGGLLGGRLPLDVAAARAAVERACARLGMTVEEAALAALKIQTHTMVQAIEENSVRRGYDPRDFTLVAFGGGGPLYACDIAQELGIPQVVVPPHPGITSAMGLLATNVAYDYVRTKMELLDEADPMQLEADFASSRTRRPRSSSATASPAIGAARAIGRLPLRRSGLRAADPAAARADRRRVAGAGARDVPRPARAALLPPLRRGADPARQHPRPSASGRSRAGARARRRPAAAPTGGGADRRVGGHVRRPRRARAPRHAALRPGAAEGGARGRRAGDHPPVRLDDGRQPRSRRPCRRGRQPADRLLRRSRHRSDVARGPALRRPRGRSPSSTR